jgi:hypothetical protein
MCIKSDNLHINIIKFDNYFVVILQTNIILVIVFYYVFMSFYKYKNISYKLFF